MRKIPSLFMREPSGLVRDEVTPGCEWVIVGEGTATRKWDGTCCLVRDGKLFRRYELKIGAIEPLSWEPADRGDPRTGNTPGWIPVSGDAPADRWHREAFRAGIPDGTYELCGPKIGGNPEGCPEHVLIPHGVARLIDCPRTFDALRAYLSPGHIEGIVWRHPDGRMAKIKGKDFGIRRHAEP